MSSSAKNHYNLVIVGAGASGLAAALSASIYEIDIVVLERNKEPGRKLNATGNGKCNFTNLSSDPEFIRSSAPDIKENVLKLFDCNDSIRFFEALGIPAFIKNGYCYPYSRQASSVTDALVCGCISRGVAFKYESRVRGIAFLSEKNMFRLTVDGYSEPLYADRVVLSAGGNAAFQYGTDGSCYYMLSQLGHNIIKPRPALVALKHNIDPEHILQGVRIEANVSLLINDVCTCSEYGEIIFNDSNISGIPVLNMSRYAVNALDEGKSVKLSIDFFKDYDFEYLKSMIVNRFRKGRLSPKNSFHGLINDKIMKYMFNKYRLSSDSLSRSEAVLTALDRITEELKTFVLQITGDMGFKNAQTTSGGLSLNELSPETLESGIVKGLYITGEILDADGRCGGYNLQWAWSTGIIAGAYAGGGKFDKSQFFDALSRA